MISRIFGLSMVLGGLVVGCASSTGDANESTEATETTTSEAPVTPVKSAGVTTQDEPFRAPAHICTGGYAPVHYWDACGAVQDYYPQGWHGWYQTAESCGDNELGYFFHPDNGAQGGYIDSWRICND